MKSFLEGFHIGYDKINVKKSKKVFLYFLSIKSYKEVGRNTLLRLVFLLTLISYTSRLLLALQQNRA